MTGRIAVALALVALPAAVAAQGLDPTVRGGSGASCFAQAPGAQPFTQSKSDPKFTPTNSDGASGNSMIDCARQGDPSDVSAKSDAKASYTATIASAGTDVFGNALVSSISITLTGEANAEAHGDVMGVGSNAVSGAEVVTSFRVLPGTMVTVEVSPAGAFDTLTLRGSGFLPSNLAGGFQGAATDQFGGVEVAFTGGAGANTFPPSPTTFNGTVTATITFGTKPPQGGCCTGPGQCSDEELQADCTGTFLGDQVLCSAGGCAGVPTPSPTATPSAPVFTWTNGSGGDYGVAGNWSPPEVPGSVVGRDDTVVFDLAGTYPVDIDGPRSVERLVVRAGRVELNNDFASPLTLAATSPSEPSVSIENTGRLDIISGVVFSVHATIGHAPPQNPASPPIAEVLVTDPSTGWGATGNLAVGEASKGRLFVANGGLVVSGSATIGGFFGGEANVGGHLTRWQTGNLAVGFGGDGPATLNVEAGGNVESGVVEIGRTPNAVAEATVTGVDLSDGASSSWNTDALTVGGAAGAGKLNVLDGGFVLTSPMTIADGAGSIGIVSVSGTNPNGTVPESRLVADSIVLGAGGDLALLAVANGGGVIVGPGNLEIARNGVGDLTIDGATSLVSVSGDVACTNAGSIAVNAGRLEIGGNLNVGVEAIISGAGTLVMTNGGTVNLLGGFEPVPPPPLPPLRRAALAPGLDPFRITGDYVQGDTGRLRIAVAGSDRFGAVAITGDATFGGTLEIAFVDGFLPAAGDAFSFLTIDGAAAGAFRRIRVRGVGEHLPFTLSLAGGAHTVTVNAAAHACSAGDTDADGLADCEVCDDCVDDDGDGLVDRADPDCAPAADGGGAGIGGDPAARKALGKCATTMAAVGAKLAALVTKRLQTCTDAVLACVQTKPGDAACLAKARAKCAKATAPLAPDGNDRRKARLTIAKACGATAVGTPPVVPLATIVAAIGLGFGAEVARCAALATPVLATAEDVIACIDRATVCRASTLVATRVPRASELLAAGGAETSLFACLPTPPAAGAGAFGDPKAVGKPLLKCQRALATAGAKLAARLGKGYGACAAAVRACVQSDDAAGCLAKASATCAKAVRALPTVGGAADAKLRTALEKACSGIVPDGLRVSSGLGFVALGERCAALGVPTLDGPASLATCLSRAQACGSATLVEAATPRLRELLSRGGAGLD